MIAVSVILVLLLCSVMSVGAATTREMTFINSLDDVVRVGWYGTPIIYDEDGLPTFGEVGWVFSDPYSGVKVNDKEYAIYAGAPDPSTMTHIRGFAISVKPSSSFIRTLQPDKDYTFKFRVGQDGTYSQPEISEYAEAFVGLQDSNGKVAWSPRYSFPTVEQDNKQWLYVTVPADQLRTISDIDQISFTVDFLNSPDIFHPDFSSIGFLMYSFASVTISDPDVEEILGGINKSTNQITGAINDSTDKITNGWDPKPEKPQGSEKVDEMSDLEDQILAGSQEGVDLGNESLLGLNDFFATFADGFMFFIGIFNLLFTNSWITRILQISLAIGLIAFVLNIVPSIGSKISSDERRAESDRRYEESKQRHREAQQRHAEMQAYYRSRGDR